MTRIYWKTLERRWWRKMDLSESDLRYYGTGEIQASATVFELVKM